MKFTIEGSKQEIESVLEEIFGKQQKPKTTDVACGDYTKPKSVCVGVDSIGMGHETIHKGQSSS